MMKTSNERQAFIGGVAFVLLLLFALQSHATTPPPPKPKPKPEITITDRQSQSQDQAQQQEQLQKQHAAASARNAVDIDVGPPEASAETGPVTVDGTGGSAATGDIVNVSEHVFYSYAQSDRPAVNCFKSGDGAAGRDGKFGALGIYWLDTNCWLNSLANEELDVELNARLKCGARKYRNAIAYDVSGGRRAKQDACVEKVKNSGLARIEAERAAMQAEIDKVTGQRDELINLRTVEKDQMDRMRKEVESKRLREAVEKR